MRFDLWAATSYGQNLDVKELNGRNRDDEGPKRDDANSARRHGLDHDRESLMRGARSDVTRWLWKILWMVSLFRCKEHANWLPVISIFGVADKGKIPLLQAEQCAPFENRERCGSLICVVPAQKIKGEPAPCSIPATAHHRDWPNLSSF